jgi:hypothetical protein
MVIALVLSVERRLHDEPVAVICLSAGGRVLCAATVTGCVIGRDHTSVVIAEMWRSMAIGRLRALHGVAND